MESLSRYFLRLLVNVAFLVLGGFVIAAAIAAYFGRTSTLDLGQAAFYAGIAMAGLAAFVMMPFQGVGGTGAMGGMSDFVRVMTLTANETNWEALHKADREHTRRGMPLAVCLGAAGLILVTAGVTVTWVAWSNA